MELQNTYFSRLPKELVTKISEYYSDPNIKICKHEILSDYLIAELTTNHCTIYINFKIPSTIVSIQTLIENINDFLNDKINFIRFNMFEKNIEYNEELKKWSVKIGDDISNAKIMFTDKKIINKILEYIKNHLETEYEKLKNLENTLNTRLSEINFSNVLDNVTLVTDDGNINNDAFFNTMLTIGTIIGNNPNIMNIMTPFINQINGKSNKHVDSETINKESETINKESETINTDSETIDKESETINKDSENKINIPPINGELKNILKLFFDRSLNINNDLPLDVKETLDNTLENDILDEEYIAQMILDEEKKQLDKDIEEELKELKK